MTRSTAELRQYLTGEWLFENDFKDTSGNGNHGTPTDIEWKPTDRGMKPKFNGSSSEVDCGNDSTLNVNHFTFGAWIQLFDGSDYQRIVDKRMYNVGGFAVWENSDVLTGVLDFTGSESSVSLFSGDGFELGNKCFITITYDGEHIKAYINGVYIRQTAETKTLGITAQNLTFGTESSSNMLGSNYSSYLYSIALTATEVLNLYNETKDAHGVIPAEHTYTHNPDDVIDVSDAVGAWGIRKESATELADISGNGNIGTIHGAMPAEGFFLSRRFDGDDDYIGCGNDSSLLSSAITVLFIYRASSVESNRLISRRNAFYMAAQLTGFQFLVYTPGGYDYITTVGDVIPLNTNIYGIITFDGTTLKGYLNGVLNVEKEHLYPGNIVTDAYDTLLGSSRGTGSFYKGNIIISKMYNHHISATEVKSHFNAVARLPFWSINFTDYPDNVTEYTDNLPYSSTVIQSGTFKVDDDKLQCVSAGTITYSASYKFDGSEYIKVTIGGVEYAGTGTITHGNTTVSVAQGSNKITIAMGIGDTIEGKMSIQFRKEV